MALTNFSIFYVVSSHLGFSEATRGSQHYTDSLI